MYFDNLTFIGLLLTLPYIIMLLMFSRHRPTKKSDEEPLFDCLDREVYRYGT
jgi:hypothetical protein